MKYWNAMALVALMAAAPACKEEQKATPDAATSAASAKRPAATGKTGLAHPDNNKEVVKLANEAIACGWQGKRLKSGCEAAKTYTKSKLIKSAEAEATLLNMIEDPKKEVRWLASKGLDVGMKAKWRKDKAAAKRVLAAATAETEESIGYVVGRLVGLIDLKATGLSGDVKKLLEGSKSVELRKGIVSNVLFNNRSEGGFYEILAKMAREHKTPALRKAAAAAFWIGGSGRKDDTCKLWLELSADADNDLAGHSAYHASWWSAGGGCTEQWDALLDTIEKRAKEGKVDSSFMTSALGWLNKQKKASDAQKKRAVVVAKGIVENDKNAKTSRADALRVIGEHDPGAKAYAAKFKDDKEFFIKTAAKRILEK